MSNVNAMAVLVGRMKVGELARMTGLDLEELVAAVLAHRPVVRKSHPPRIPGDHGAKGDAAPVVVARAVARAHERSPEAVSFPELGGMVGRATYRQIHLAVDRWLLGNVWEQEGHNVSRAAGRLEISRRRYRDLFARTKDDDGGTPVAVLEGRPSESVPPPVLEPLLAAGTYRVIHDEADRWMLGHVVEWTQGNLTHAARHLDVSRKHLREHLARVGLR